MILKLRIKGKEKRVAWRILDKIKEIEYKYMDEPKDMQKYLDSGIIYINAYPNLIDKNVVEISMTYDNGFSDMMFTDDIAYVLNDNGKTCDSINA